MNYQNKFVWLVVATNTGTEKNWQGLFYAYKIFLAQNPEAKKDTARDRNYPCRGCRGGLPPAFRPAQGGFVERRLCPVRDPHKRLGGLYRWPFNYGFKFLCHDSLSPITRP